MNPNIEHTLEELAEAREHRLEVTRQANELIRLFPWKENVFKKQLRELLAQIDKDLAEGKYLVMHEVCQP